MQWKPGKLGTTRDRLSFFGLTGIAGLALLAAACSTASATAGSSADFDHPSNAAGETRPVTTPSSQAKFPSNALCLACHSQPGLFRPVGNAEDPLDTVNAQAFAASAHGGTACAKCHPGNAAVPHLLTADGKPVTAAIDANRLCSSCHQDAAEGYEHTVHGVVSNLGDRRAPGCTDCHSAHAVNRVSEWTSTERGQACARCHDGADGTFAQAATGHREASTTWFAPTYFAGRFLVVLLACTLAFGTIHVELDMLRWGFAKVRGRHDPEKSE